MRLFLASFGRALLSQLHIRMLLLTLLPFVFSLSIWAVCLWLGLQPMIDWLQEYFIVHSVFGIAGTVLNWFGMGTLKTVIVPMLAMWALLPLMILTALVFVGLFTIPAVARHIGARHYPSLSKQHGGSVWGSLWTSLWCFAVFTVLWLLTLPVSLIPPLSFIVHPLLWGWLTYRVMAYDTLADYATPEERRILLRLHRWPLLAIGTIAGAMGAAPTLLWLGGALSVIFFPVLAAGAIWLYVLVFVFTGLWFQYYCLEALLRHRTGQPPDVPLSPDDSLRPAADIIDVDPR
ncbi:EI24 domain-containing protein [Herbaspirillum sp. LeCh32-8]|uniref:EI24 domain-containing protein n=1 Tax=Herbaspirillum sp. LeCh32-8 TaxID=2821356 RepID=UPI001AE60489|nr:EI24 domain-containing protein [Herbaspirillum sp. LeCh32-8]MBP0600181.1 EI24 domain-containing protein [Herbaspirillum sp. LeCh32-8]